jgi:hypothetical protein
MVLQLSYPITEYRKCVERAFCELLIGHQYASQLPNIDRFTKFLTRLKESEFDSGDPFPDLTITDLCKKGLPINWAYIQFSRGPLQIVEEDEFRLDTNRMLSDDANRTMFKDDRWGFGRTELNFWLIANNGSAIEAAEALYYMRLYKLKSVDFLYLETLFHSRIVHDMLTSFEPLGIDEYGTGFTITWRLEMYVPILRQEVEGFTVQSTCAEIFDRSELFDPCTTPAFPIPLDPFPLETEKEPDFSIHARPDDPTIKEGKIRIEETEGNCEDESGSA